MQTSAFAKSLLPNGSLLKGENAGCHLRAGFITDIPANAMKQIVSDNLPRPGDRVNKNQPLFSGSNPMLPVPRL